MRWLVGVLLVLAACSGGSGPEGGQGGEWGGGEQKAPATVVEVAIAAKGEVSDLLATTAVVESEAQADIVPMSPGIVLEVRKEEGDEVRKGDVLAILDNVSLDASAERTAAEVSRLEREAATARDLHARGAISDQELADAEHALTTARTSAREASRTFGQTRLTAPFDGVVAMRDVRVGEYVTGAQKAFQVVDPKRLRAVASLPERDLGRVSIGQKARLVAAYDHGRTAAAEVLRIAPVVQAETGTFRVTLAVDPEQSLLRPGQFVSIEIEVDVHQDVVVVPREALVYEDGMPVVYKMVPAPPPAEKKGAEEPEATAGSWWPFGGGAGGEEKKEEAKPDPFVAARTSVKLGLVDTDTAEVLEGVTPGDQVIVLGQSNLRDQAPVQTPAMLAEQKKKSAETKAAEKPGDEG
jgi:membrane fusion protein (multidrug efflux system)